MYRGRVWQNRFWDHVIRDEDDFDRHLDYIHRNSVKHGFSSGPFDWSYSSFRKFHEMGIYEGDWGLIAPRNEDNDYGE